MSYSKNSVYEGIDLLHDNIRDTISRAYAKKSLFASTVLTLILFSGMFFTYSPTFVVSTLVLLCICNAYCLSMSYLYFQDAIKFGTYRKLVSIRWQRGLRQAKRLEWKKEVEECKKKKNPYRSFDGKVIYAQTQEQYDYLKYGIPL